MPREQSESIISARLRRLREEEPALSMSPFVGLQVPAGHNKRERRLLVEDRDELVATVDDDGGLKVEVRRFTAVADVNASPLQAIVWNGWICGRDEPETMRELRITAALRYRSLYEGGKVSPLKAQSYEGGGGGGGAPRPVSDHSIDCIKKLESIEREVPAAAMKAVVDAVCNDTWIWEGKTPADIAADVDLILAGLDFLAAYYGYITKEEVRTRWPDLRPAPARRASEKPSRSRASRSSA